MIPSQILHKNFYLSSTIYFHGTTSKNYESLKSGVVTSFCQDFTDFGKGFYLTSNFNQASKHAKKRVKGNEYPIVFVFNASLTRLVETYKGYILNKMDEEWAEFIYKNRSRKTGFTHFYDFVLGGVTDGNIFDLVQLVDLGLSIKDFYESIAKYPNYNQLSITQSRYFHV